MDEIFVTMLGHFDIFVGGDSALAHLGNSSKSIVLLKFFLLNRGKPISVSDLVDMFWSEPDKSANPENALKTMISRIRFSLAKSSPLLKNCILSEKKSYMWNPEVVCAIDVFIFEELCASLEQAETFDDDVRARYMKSLSLYGGDLSYASSDEDWIVSRSMYLHHLYLKMVYRFIKLLKTVRDFEMVIHVCRIALDVDTFDETLNLELMNALKESGQSSAALMQYRHITGAYYKYLGIEPSERILSFYKDLIKADLKEEADLGSIRQDLKKSDHTNMGAFICDYSIFRDIYQLQIRNLERQNSKMFLSLVAVSQILEDKLNPLVLDGVMRDLLDILRIHLRKGDVIARYSPTQYAVLLPMTSHSTGGNAVVERVKKAFYKKYADNGFKISFQFEQMD